MNAVEQGSIISSFAKAHDLLLERASAAAGGLTDFGTNYEEGYRRLLEGLDTESHLTPGARIATAAQIETYLMSRLYSEQGWKQYSDCRKLKIERPLIITGIVRSGTTALHKLMSMDPQFQGIEHWLARSPMPRPPRERWHENAEFRRISKLVADMIAGAPEIFEDHGMAVDEVEESMFLLPQSFFNNTFPAQWTLPSYDRWYLSGDETASYERFADNLRLIGYYEPNKRWLLKNPADIHAIDAVLKVFPDAMIVQTHRDPVQAVPSVVNLIHAARKMFEGPHVEVSYTMRRETALWAKGVSRADAMRSRAPDQFFDVWFADFVNDQLSTVRRIYDHFGLTLTPEVEMRMREWLDAHPRKSSTMQRFRPEDFGMSSDHVREVYADYRKKYGFV